MSLSKVNKETGDLTPVAGTYVPNAAGIAYDNTESGLAVGNVQSAIDEVKNKTQFCKSITNDTGSDIWCRLYAPVSALSTDSITFTLTAGKSEEYKLILSIVSGGPQGLHPMAAQVTRVTDAWNQAGQGYHGFAIDKFVWYNNGYYIHVIHDTTVRVTQTTATEGILPFDFTIMPAPAADAYVIPISEMPPSFDYMNLVRSSNWAKMGEKYTWQPGFLRQGRLPRKVVVIGNSMTYHGPASYWEVNDLREMAASTPTSGWVSLVYKELKKYFPNIVMYKANGAPWETAALGSRAFSNIASQSVALMTDSGCEATSLTLSDVLTSDVDIVISQLYENVPDVSASEVATLSKDYSTLYDSILEKSPNAFLYQFCGFWQTITKHRAVLCAIQNRGEPIYAPCLNPYNTGVAQSMVENKHSFFEAQTGDNIYDGNGNVITTVTSTVAGHPNDLGFKVMAAHVICHLYNQYGIGDSGKEYPQFKPTYDGKFDLDNIDVISELFFAQQASAASSDPTNMDWLYKISHPLYSKVFDFFLLAGIYRITLNFESPTNAQHCYLRTTRKTDNGGGYLPLTQEICSCNSFDKFTRSVNLSAFDTVFTAWLPGINKYIPQDGTIYYTGEIYNGVPVKRLCIVPSSDFAVATDTWSDVPGSSAAFDNHPTEILAAFTSSPVIEDTRVGNIFDRQGLRFNFSSTSTAIRIASFATFTWYKNTTLYVDYI